MKKAIHGEVQGLLNEIRQNRGAVRAAAIDALVSLAWRILHSEAFRLGSSMGFIRSAVIEASQKFKRSNRFVREFRRIVDQLVHQETRPLYFEGDRVSHQEWGEGAIDEAGYMEEEMGRRQVRAEEALETPLAWIEQAYGPKSRDAFYRVVGCQEPASEVAQELCMKEKELKEFLDHLLSELRLIFGDTNGKKRHDSVGSWNTTPAAQPSIERRSVSAELPEVGKRQYRERPLRSPDQGGRLPRYWRHNPNRRQGARGKRVGRPPQIWPLILPKNPSACGGAGQVAVPKREDSMDRLPRRGSAGEAGASPFRGSFIPGPGLWPPGGGQNGGVQGDNERNFYPPGSEASEHPQVGVANPAGTQAG